MLRVSEIGSWGTSWGTSYPQWCSKVPSWRIRTISNHQSTQLSLEIASPPTYLDLKGGFHLFPPFACFLPSQTWEHLTLEAVAESFHVFSFAEALQALASPQDEIAFIAMYPWTLLLLDASCCFVALLERCEKKRPLFKVLAKKDGRRAGTHGLESSDSFPFKYWILNSLLLAVCCSLVGLSGRRKPGRKRDPLTV